MLLSIYVCVCVAAQVLLRALLNFVAHTRAPPAGRLHSSGSDYKAYT